MSATRALEGCRVVHASGIEIVEAPRALRAFPERVSTSLGVCLKRGPAHRVISDGARRDYPEDAICVRAPGCVWASDPSDVAFVSIDVDPALLDDAIEYAPMTFHDTLPELHDAITRVSACPFDTALREESIALLLEGLRARSALRFGRARRTRDDAVARALAHLDATLDRNVALDELAHLARSDKFVLVRRFRREIGTTPHAYHLRVRIERARAALASGTGALEVAMSLGFADQSHFGRHFRRIVGVTPAAYARGTTR
ncbi:helix-turn-helix domain-containing protein [Sandaracinus amylolyticus]|uniref:helix-turn-helix domain-containing protein n=1 Tax=Sandaracinus amylolyticus TaxID=927083 RepID=UPI001F37CA78|nr:AraC family transcriptional regulator [Sandaracinus amylolyticus]UJR82157.1 Transcriptional regulator, AraC family protein [Sandaracinus amylolyticus]